MYIHSASRALIVFTKCTYRYIHCESRVSLAFTLLLTTQTHVTHYPDTPGRHTMGWLRLVGSLKLQVSFAEYRLFYRALLQKRPAILSSLLIVATPYHERYLGLSKHDTLNESCTYYQRRWHHDLVIMGWLVEFVIECVTSASHSITNWNIFIHISPWLVEFVIECVTSASHSITNWNIFIHISPTQRDTSTSLGQSLEQSEEKTWRILSQTKQVIPLLPTHHVIQISQGQSPGRAHGKTWRILSRTRQVIPLSPTHHVILKPQGQLLRRAEEKIWRILSHNHQVIPLSPSHGVI